MSSVMERLRRLERAATATNHPPIIVISGTDEEHNDRHPSNVLQTFTIYV